ncbi:MAG: N-acetyltransferase [Coriobacteriia bacterium]|nr:N-acetyltransferase [Coriobacteriia bacterium]
MANLPTVGDNFEHGIGIVAHPSVIIGDNVSLGHHVVIEPDAKIGDNVRIGNHVSVGRGAKISNGCVVADFAVVGRPPALSVRSTAKGEDLPGVELGAGCKIGSHTVLMAGTTLDALVVVGDNAGVRERCTIGKESVIGRGVTVENDTEIGERVKIQSGAYITAYVTIEDDVFVAPMVVTTNDNFMGRTEERREQVKGCTIRRGARIGGGAHLLPGIEIGEDAFVATAAVVTKDVPPRTLVMGVPARVVREVPEEQLLDNQ